jgi:hypothetical protein
LAAATPPLDHRAAPPDRGAPPAAPQPQAPDPRRDAINRQLIEMSRRHRERVAAGEPSAAEVRRAEVNEALKALSAAARGATPGPAVSPTPIPQASTFRPMERAWPPEDGGLGRFGLERPQRLATVGGINEGRENGWLTLAHNPAQRTGLPIDGDRAGVAGMGVGRQPARKTVQKPIGEVAGKPEPRKQPGTADGSFQLLPGEEPPGPLESAVYDFWRSKGWTHAQAAGVIGNLHVESYGFGDQHIYGGYKGRAYGIGQWLGSRKANLFAYADEQETLTFDKRGRPITDLQTQLEFQQMELTRGHPYEDRTSRRYADRLRSATDAESALKAFTGVLRPNSVDDQGRAKLPYDPANPTRTHHYERRQSAAKRAERMYRGR